MRIDPAERRHRPINHHVDLIALAHVGGKNNGVRADIVQLAFREMNRLRIIFSDDHARAARREMSGECQSYSLTAARHDHALTTYVRHPIHPVFSENH